MRARSFRPDVRVFDAGPTKWRGGVLWSLAGETATIRLLAEASFVRDKPVATSLIPADSQTIGQPLACRVTGTGADDYVIVEVVGSFSPDGLSDQAGAVVRNEFHPGVIPRAITQTPLTWWEE